MRYLTLLALFTVACSAQPPRKITLKRAPATEEALHVALQLNENEEQRLVDTRPSDWIHLGMMFDCNAAIIDKHNQAYPQHNIMSTAPIRDAMYGKPNVMRTKLANACATETIQAVQQELDRIESLQ